MLRPTELMPWAGARFLPYGTRGFERPFESLPYELDRFVEDMFRGFDFPTVRRVEPRYAVAVPRVDVVEDEKEIRVYAELPAMDKDNIEVAVSDDMLTIKGEKKLEKEETGKEYALRERAFGSFYRQIPLAVEIVADKVEASFENGLLTVTLPKTAEMRTKFKKIPVHTVHGTKSFEKVEKKAA